MIVQSMPYPAGGVTPSFPLYISTGAHNSGSAVANYPASIAAGDFLLATVWGSGDSLISYSGPAGWTRITQVSANSLASGVTIQHHALFYRIADGSESGTATFTASGAVANVTAAAISRFDGATSFESLCSLIDITPSTTTSPQITTTDDDRLLVNTFSVAGGASYSLTPDTGWTEAFEYNRGNIGSQYDATLHYRNASATGLQLAEDAIASDTANWNIVSLALCPSGSIPTPSISVRATTLVHVNNVSSCVMTLPTGSAAGDRIFIFAQHGYAASFLNDNVLLVSQTGSNINGQVWEKILTAADISTGSITISFAGAYYGSVAAITFVGVTGGRRTVTSSRNTASVVCFGSTRATGATCASTVGSSLQTLSASNASACLFGGVLGSSGAVSSDFSYSVLGSGDFQAILVVRPSA
jgi:hypothetical protein